MSVLLYGASHAEPGTYERAIHDGFAPWAIRRIPQMVRSGITTFGPCVVFVVASSADPKARILAVVVFHNFVAGFKSVEVSMASDSPMWCRPHILSALLGYVFNTAGCGRLQAITPRRGRQARHTQKLLRNIGFRWEGTHRRAMGFDDACSFAMVREDAARWIGEVGNAQIA
jgi:RimJ/RimL family protein N-acetyltransferase